MQDQSFQLLLNGVPYEVKAKPFEFNTETRFNVTINGSAEYIFAYDTSVGQFVSIDEDAESVPADVELAISERLYALA